MFSQWSSSNRGVKGSVPKTSISKCLVSHDLGAEKRVDYIKKLLKSEDEKLGAKSLEPGDALKLVELLDEALRAGRLPQNDQPTCVRYLARVCAWHRVLPNSVQVSDYQLVSEHGNGGFSNVWLGTHNGEEVVIKELKFFSSYTETEKMNLTKAFCKEVIVWRHLSHPNIVPFIGAVMVTEQGHEKYQIVSELMTNGRIGRFIERNQDANKVELLKDVAAGLSYLHSQDIIHGDLKGPNILVNKHGRACLADFGLSRVIAGFTSSGTGEQGGTTAYMSPELLWPEKYGFKAAKPTTKSDIFALGIVIYETMCGRRPHHEFAEWVIAEKFRQGDLPSRPEVGFTDPLWKTVKRCWQRRPETRPDADAVLKVLNEVLRG